MSFRDIYLAAALCTLGHEPVDIVEAQDGRYEFLFPNEEGILALCKDFKMRRLRAEPMALFENLRRLKTPVA